MFQGWGTPLYYVCKFSSRQSSATEVLFAHELLPRKGLNLPPNRLANVYDASVPRLEHATLLQSSDNPLILHHVIHLVQEKGSWTQWSLTVLTVVLGTISTAGGWKNNPTVVNIAGIGAVLIPIG